VIAGRFSKGKKGKRKGPEEKSGSVLKIRKSGIALTFTNADFVSNTPGCDDHMVITGIIVDYEVHGIFMD